VEDPEKEESKEKEKTEDKDPEGLRFPSST